MIRLLLTAFTLAILAAPVSAAPPRPKKVTTERAVKQSFGVLAISIRSEIYLPDKLDVFFVRDGGDVRNDKDVFRVSRTQSLLAVDNDTGDFVTKSYLLAPGRYRLAGYGVNCPGVPPPGMVCAVTITMYGIRGAPTARPSRGYTGETPSFEIEPGKLTVIGDLILTNENYMLWAPLPEAEVVKLRTAFPGLSSGSEPVIPEEFVLRRAFQPHGVLENFRRKL